MLTFSSAPITRPERTEYIAPAPTACKKRLLEIELLIFCFLFGILCLFCSSAGRLLLVRFGLLPCGISRAADKQYSRSNHHDTHQILHNVSFQTESDKIENRTVAFFTYLPHRILHQPHRACNNRHSSPRPCPQGPSPAYGG